MISPYLRSRTSMVFRLSILLVSLLFQLTLSAQLGGSSVYRVLDIPASARVNSLGGNQIAVYDHDLNLGVYNPSLLNPEMDKQLSLSYLDWFAGVNIGYASYGHHFDSLNTTFAATLQYVNYGDFTRTDETGEELGSFNAGEYVLNIGAGRAIDSLFSIGANLKFIYSGLDDLSSYGVAVDAGGTYVSRTKKLTIAAMLRNIGYQIDPYQEEREDLPFEAQLGITYRFKHAPFRLGLVFDDLQKWDLSYEDPNQTVQIDPTTGEAIVDKVTVVDKLLLHMIFNTEVIFNKNFMLRFGYNYRRRQELKIADKPGAVGISYGLGLRLSKFHLSYGRSTYHRAGASNTFSVGVQLADFKRKPKPTPDPGS